MIKIEHGPMKDGLFARITNVASPVTVEGPSEIMCLEKICRRVRDKDAKIVIKRV